MRDYKIVSTDSHLEISPDRWRDYVDAEFREYTPRVVKLPNGGDAWLMPGKTDPVPLGLNFSAGRGFENLKISGLSYEEGLVGSGGPDQRLQEMDLDGIDAEILFPAVSGQRTLDTGAIPGEAYYGIVRGYNDWLSDFCKEDPDRLLGIALLPTSGLDDAIAEMRRVSLLPGIRAVILHRWPNGSGGPSPDDDRFWAATLEARMPLTAHVTFGSGVLEDRRMPKQDGISLMNFAPINAMMTKGLPNAYEKMQLITEGIFDRFPALQFFFAEIAIGWIPYLMERSDDEYMRHRYWAGIEMEHEPSWYLKRNFHWGMWIDRVGLRNRDLIGVDHIQWSTDFPHVVTDWPNSRRQIEEEFADIPADERHKMICGNAVRYFHLDAAR
jgi:predicted TIM-barrel fold metal-dependent hydrolase